MVANVDFKALPVVRVSSLPLTEDDEPVWTPELEEIVAQYPSENGTWFRLRYRDDPLLEGLACACGFQPGVRKWNLRLITIPVENGWAVAAFEFFYKGEDRKLPDGGEKMYWRLPVHKRVVELYTSDQAAVSALFSKAETIDKIAEEAFAESAAAGGSFLRGLMDDLSSGQVPSARKLADRMLNPRKV